ncbi:MAG: PP2C family protein-serine/threonine phosphatase [Solidesulfovibrio sp. DCME]|uniref:PP2C family protein-serine/threonine phosphatase n=1 Tax=Solidesulfovibrio sp. DCME TaxID=3447380 RepID=UPI003D13D0DE
MEALPPVWLGAMLAGSFALMLAGRPLAMHRFVLAASSRAQPGRQGLLEFVCCLFAGSVAGLGVEALYGFPLVTGWKLAVGGAAAGFYLGLESGLLRLRDLVRQARHTDVFPRATAPGDLRSLARRFLFLASVATLLLMGLLALIWAGDVAWLSTLERTPEVLARARRTVMLENLLVLTILFLCAARIIVLYAGNLRLLFHTVTDGLARVSQGDLTVRLPVVTADEFGRIAAGVNAMVAGLSHRVRLLDALKVAEDVQRNLLPGEPPRLTGLDVAASSVYCDETGGDYYDCITLGAQRFALVVGDVAGHGVGSALLMASARASVRMAAALGGDPVSVVGAVNGRLCEDVNGTGRFVTLFYLDLDARTRLLRWVRAGQDPAMLYLPEADRFEDLAGPGVPLGVVAGYGYRESRRAWPEAGLLFLGTDGIWEARNRAGEMFGKERLREVLRRAARLPAQEVVAAVTEAVTAFRQGLPQEDDITMVVITFPEAGGAAASGALAGSHAMG